MVDQEAISTFQKRLDIHRRNLQHLLNQAAQYGGESHAPLEIMNSIRDQRAHIADTKAILRTNGVSVEDEPSERLSAEGSHIIDPKDRRLATRFEHVLNHISGQLAMFLAQHKFADAMRIMLDEHENVPDQIIQIPL
jgi:hypothetical protein